MYACSDWTHSLSTLIAIIAIGQLITTCLLHQLSIAMYILTGLMLEHCEASLWYKTHALILTLNNKTAHAMLCTDSYSNTGSCIAIANCNESLAV